MKQYKHKTMNFININSAGLNHLDYYFYQAPSKTKDN